MDKGSKICVLYILNGSTVICHASSVSEDFHDKNMLWNLRSTHVKCMEVVVDNFNEFCKKQGIKTNLAKFGKLLGVRFPKSF